MQADIAFDKIEKMLPYLSEILTDADGKALMDSIRKDKDQSAGQVMGAILPLFVTTHREAVFGIVAALKDITTEEAKQLDLKELSAAMRDNFVGDVLLFFGSCLTMARCM